MTNQETLPKGVWGAKLVFAKTFSSNKPTSVAPRSGATRELVALRLERLCSVLFTPTLYSSSNTNRKYFRYRQVPVSIRSRYGEPI